MQQPPWGAQGPGAPSWGGQPGPNPGNPGQPPQQNWGQPPPGGQQGWGQPPGQAPYGGPPQPGWGGPPAFQEGEPEPEQSLDFGSAFKFVFSNEDSTNNLLFGSLFMLIPIIGPIALGGWQTEILQRLVKKHPKPIPKLDFNDFMYYVSRGITAFLTQILMQVPFQIIFGVLYFVFIIGSVAAGAATGGSRGGGSAGMVAMLTMYGIFLACVMAIVPLMMLISSVLITRAEICEDFGTTFKFGEILDQLKKTWLTIIGSTMLYAFIGQWIAMIGMMAACVGLFPAAVLLQLGATHLRYQIYKKFRARGGAAIPMKQAAPLPSGG